MMATAVLFLHELRHVKFHADHMAGYPRPTDFAEEELQCDVWAREWFMSGLSKFATENNHTYVQVCSKRAMALLFVCEYLRLADQHAGAIINTDYPPISTRIAALSGAVNLPEKDHFWVFSACILLAEARRQGTRLPRLGGTSPKKLTESLIDLLKQ